MLPRPVAFLPRLLVALPILVAGCQPADSPSPPHRPQRTIEAPQPGKFGTVLKARAVRVQDGDSFVARLDDGSSRTIRLSGIDAPERSQQDGDESQQNLRRLLENRDLQVRVAKEDPYGRAVAQVFVDRSGAPVDVGLSQVADGMAWFYRRYRQDLPSAAVDRYAEAEAAAKKQKKGLWHAANPEPPWDFRRRHPSDGRGSRH
jgi:endonuclease YncB( thermonuclease family)